MIQSDGAPPVDSGPGFMTRNPRRIIVPGQNKRVNRCLERSRRYLGSANDWHPEKRTPTRLSYGVHVRMTRCSPLPWRPQSSGAPFAASNRSWGNPLSGRRIWRPHSGVALLSAPDRTAVTETGARCGSVPRSRSIRSRCERRGGAPPRADAQPSGRRQGAQAVASAKFLARDGRIKTSYDYIERRFDYYLRLSHAHIRRTTSDETAGSVPEAIRFLSPSLRGFRRNAVSLEGTRYAGCIAGAIAESTTGPFEKIETKFRILPAEKIIILNEFYAKFKRRRRERKARPYFTSGETPSHIDDSFPLKEIKSTDGTSSFKGVTCKEAPDRKSCIVPRWMRCPKRRGGCGVSPGEYRKPHFYRSRRGREVVRNESNLVASPGLGFPGYSELKGDCLKDPFSTGQSSARSPDRSRAIPTFR
jgi:hypothetical protein